MSRKCPEPDLFAPRVFFRGAVNLYHRGSGETLEWSAVAFDVAIDLKGSIVFENWRVSPHFRTEAEACSVFGKPRDCPPRLIEAARAEHAAASAA